MLNLAIFDVDGTLIDSQDAIVAAMDQAHARAGLAPPTRARTLSIVGLSLPEAMRALHPERAAQVHAALVGHYKASFQASRHAGAGDRMAPFFPGAEAAIERLDAAGWLISAATGKSRRGLDHLLGSHGIGRYFIGTQTADDAPSKPSPQMLLQCLSATGMDAANAVMIGDTVFDIAMARAAGVRAIGVAWGYHDAAQLVAAGAERVLGHFDELDEALGLGGAR